MKKLLSLGIAILTLAACNMDFYRSDTMTSNMLKDNPGAASIIKNIKFKTILIKFINS